MSKLHLAKKMRAFTLAEVLITLGIIGVVAALTIPTLNNYINEKTFLTQFQTAYSDLNQAYALAVRDNGTADTWADANAAYANMNPYLKSIKSAQFGFGPYSVKRLNGQGSIYSKWYQIILANGAFLNFEDDNGILLTLDTNGLKGPNQWGYDIFALLLNTKNGSPFLSWPYYGTWADSDSEWCDKTNTDIGWENGIMCSYWVIKHGNMDYMHRVIPDNEWLH